MIKELVAVAPEKEDQALLSSAELVGRAMRSAGCWKRLRLCLRLHVHLRRRLRLRPSLLLLRLDVYLSLRLRLRQRPPLRLMLRLIGWRAGWSHANKVTWKPRSDEDAPQVGVPATSPLPAASGWAARLR